MRKEVLMAIVLGFALGMVITFGIWSANRALKEKGETTVGQEVLPAPEATLAPVPAFSLVILSPEDESLVDKEKITLSGTTEPEAWVMVIGERGETMVEADETGQFATEITLESGTNEITVTATNEAGEEASRTIDVVYSTSEI